MSFPLETCVNGGRMDPSLVSDRIKEYVQRIQSRPAYIKALEKGPDYAYGKLYIFSSLSLSDEPPLNAFVIQAQRTSCKSSPILTGI